MAFLNTYVWLWYCPQDNSTGGVSSVMFLPLCGWRCFCSFPTSCLVTMLWWRTRDVKLEGIQTSKPGMKRGRKEGKQRAAGERWKTVETPLNSSGLLSSGTCLPSACEQLRCHVLLAGGQAWSKFLKRIFSRCTKYSQANISAQFLIVWN